MKKPIRYILYFLAGISLYFFIGADDNPEVMDDFHSYAPGLIIGVVVLMFFVRYMRTKQEKDRDGEPE